MFRALCAHFQEVKFVLHSFWYHHTCRWPSRAQVERRQNIKICPIEAPNIPSTNQISFRFFVP